MVNLIKIQWHTIKQNIPLKVWRILKGFFNYVFKRNKDISEERQKICNRCNQILNVDNEKFCGICGCMISLKTTVKEEVCPIKKW